jgi:hypothetical protein
MIVAGLIIVAVALYLVYFLIPYFNDSNEADKKLMDAQTQLSALNARALGASKLNGEIEELNGQLREQWSSVPTGIDHARILLYLKQLTDGRAESVAVTAPETAKPDGSFLLQTFTLDCRTSYRNLLGMLDDLKKGELYNRVTLLRADYRSNGETENATPAPGETEPVATPTPAPKHNSDYVISVHMEFSFVALQPADGEMPEPAMTPTNKQRSDSLMPEK